MKEKIIKTLEGFREWKRIFCIHDYKVATILHISDGQMPAYECIGFNVTYRCVKCGKKFNRNELMKIHCVTLNCVD